MSTTLRPVRDGTGASFDVYFWHDGTGFWPTQRGDIIYSLAESVRTQAHAVAGNVTFSAPIRAIRIANLGPTDGVFTVNGMNIPLPAYVGVETRVEGTPSNTVGVAGATNYQIHRLL